MHRVVRLTAVAAVALVAACGSGGDSASPTSDPKTITGGTSAGGGNVVTITMKDTAFSPATLTVSAGQPIRVVNKDPFAHTFTADQRNAQDQPIFNLNPEQLEGNKSTQIKVFEKGTHAYHCTLHPTMKGTLTVE